MLLRTISEQNQNDRMQKSSFLPADFQEALDFAMMYRLIKQEQNMNPLSFQPSSSINKKSTQSKKKSTSFQRPTKSKVNKSFQFNPQPSSKHKPKFIQQAVQQQYCFKTQQKYQPQNNNSRSLNDFISQLSTPTQLYVKQQSVIYDHPSKGFQHKYQPQYKNNFDWNSISINKSHKQQKPVYEQAYQTTKSNHNQNYKNNKSNSQKNQIKSSSNLNQYNVQYSEQKYDNYYTKKQNKEELQSYLPRFNTGGSNFSSTQAFTNDIKSSNQTPQFSMHKMKIHDFTKTKNAEYQNNNTDSNWIYESPHRDFYQPSPTKSKSVTPQKKKTNNQKNKHKFKQPSSSQNSCSEHSQQIQSKKLSYQKHTNKSQINKNRHFSSSKNMKTQTIFQKPIPQKQQSYASDSQQQYRQSVKTFQKHKKKPTNNDQQYPTHRTQPPKPSSSQITNKPLPPKININKSQQKVCKLPSDKQYNSSQSSFDSQFKYQLNQIQSCKNIKEVNIDLSKYNPYSRQSDEQSYQDDIQVYHKPKNPTKSQYKK